MNWNDLSRDQLVNHLGLNRQYSGTEIIVPALAIFGAGVLVGAGLGLLFAPKSGQELRHDITDGMSDLKQRGTHLIEDAKHNIEAKLRLGGTPAPSTAEQADNPFVEET